MKLRRIHIQSIPGLADPLKIDDLDDGLNIILGPNGIGKSRMSQAIRGLLWNDSFKEPRLIAKGSFEHEGVPWHVERDGTRHRWQCNGIDSEPPLLPAQELDRCFFLGLRDLLDNRDTAGRDLASKIRTQMSGGFDLDSVASQFSAPLTSRAGSKESQAVETAAKKIHQARRAQSQVGEDEDQLEALRVESKDAKSAQERLDHFKAAIGLCEDRTNLAEARRKLADLPAAVARLDGGERERLDKIDGELRSQQTARDAEESAVESSIAAIQSTGLDAAIAPSVLLDLRSRIDELVQLERDLKAARTGISGRKGVVERRRADLGAEPDATIDLTLESDIDLFDLLQQEQTFKAESVAVEERLAILAEIDGPKDGEQQAAALQRAIVPLRDWLRAPEPAGVGADAKVWPPRLWWLIAGGVLGGVGLALAFAMPLNTPGMLVLGLGVGLAIAGLISRTENATPAENNRRALAEQDFPESVDAPASWSVADVTTRLAALEDESAKLDSEWRRADRRATDRVGLLGRQADLEKTKETLQANRSALAGRLGLDSARSVAQMVDLARMLAELRDAQAAFEAERAECEKLEGDLNDLLDVIASSFASTGETRPGDGISAGAQLASLEKRNRDLETASKDEATAKGACKRIDKAVTELLSRKTDLFETLDLAVDDGPGLTRLLDDLETYRTLVDEIRGHDATTKRVVERLEACNEAGLSEMNIEDLERQHGIHEAESQKFEGLTRKIGIIEDRAEIARGGHAVEDAIATRDEALTALRNKRDELLDATTASFLLGEVQREHETHQSPRVLKSAMERFGAFTHQRYKLIIDPKDKGSFNAVDQNTERGQKLSELSDGTRAQLILAARLAFAEDVSHGADLPLFLDEALDHSDPERFHAIACSLARMIADEGRQVFYLTNDPNDIAAFHRAFEEEGCALPNTIDLGELHQHRAMVSDENALRAPALRPVPNPDGLSVEAYGQAIEVAPLDPSGDALGHPVYYLLRDDLPLLYEILQARLSTMGQCRNLLAGESKLAQQIKAHGPIGAQLDARIDLFENFCLAWCEGRGRPVGRIEIEASSAVKPTFIDKVVEIAGELSGDAQRLIEVLQERNDDRLSGFRANTTVKLEQFFTDQGHIDPRPVLGEEQLVERAISTPAADLLTAKRASELTALWWTLCEQTAGR
jgi:exonuclease SbcC